MDSYRAYTTENFKIFKFTLFFFIIASQKCVPLAKIIDNGGKKSVFFLKKINIHLGEITTACTTLSMLNMCLNHITSNYCKYLLYALWT